MSTETTKTAIITGGTKGTGRAIADRFALLGMNLVLGYNSDDDAAAAAATELARNSAASVVALKSDVRKRSDVEELFRQAIDKHGQIDIVIANAGFEVIDGPFATMEEDRVDHVVDVNVKGTFFTLQQAALHISDGGRIVVTGSAIAFFPSEGAGVYTATKAALHSMVEVLSKGLAPRHVTVNSLAPGMVRNSGVFTRSSGSEDEPAIGVAPLGRWVEASDVAGSAVFLTSDDAAMITGNHLRITGGLVG